MKSSRRCVAMNHDESEKSFVLQQRAYESAYLYVKSFEAAKQMWTTLLTDSDRESLGGTDEALDSLYREMSTAGIWAKQWKISTQRAVVEIAYQLEYLSETKARWLLSEMGEETDTLVQANVTRAKPKWDLETGKLYYRDQIIRILRKTKKPTNIHLILDTFEEDGWPSRIDSPIPDDSLGGKLHEAIRSLKKDLIAVITFSVQEGGKAVIWKSVD